MMMYNVIKSVNYSMRRDIAVILTLCTLMVFPFLAGALLDSLPILSLAAGDYFLSMIPEYYVIYILGAMILAAKCCGADAGDRTLNYELLSGHAREESYWGRFAAGLFWAFILVLLFIFLPVLCLDIKNGWGGKVDSHDAFFHAVLLTLPTLRATAFFMMLSTVVRGAGKGIVIGYLSVMFMVTIDEILNSDSSFDFYYLTSLGNGMEVLDLTIASDKVFVTVIVSLIMTIVYAMVGYLHFKRKDRD